ncbi:MAG TPA: NADH-quinone oxidoreductase subunit NuoN [Gammaproteobacteria bacterium]|nr:NADH-quinone oxidoreductase subunit NuoN [Gammaproteobacteria bacterium]
MDFAMPNFTPAIPEIFVLVMACLILVVDLFLREDNRIITYLLTQATLVGAAVLTLSSYPDQVTLTFTDTFVRDRMGDVLKVFIYLVTAVVFLYSRDYLRTRQLYKGEYFVVGLFAVLGMMVLVSAHSLLTVYLGLELLSLSLYTMVAMRRNSLEASEAAMKYFVLGALASGLLLYGMSMLYGVTGTLDIAQISASVAHSVQAGQGAGTNVVLVFALVFIIIGVMFKLGAAPFHMWIPDVYHGAPTSVTLFIAGAPKIAAFAMLMRLMVEGLGPLHVQWQDMLIILSVLSMAVGNIIAIAQANLKRMLAYSTIAHVGFLLLGVLSGSQLGYSAAMFYIIAYAIMSIGGFGMIILLSRAGFEADRLDDFKGLNQRSPWFAFMMLILMFSMAGVPPTLGFYAKLSVLQAVVHADLVWLAALAVLLSVIGAFYYLRIIKLMYFDKPEDTVPLDANLDIRVAMTANGLAVLALGIFPGALLTLCAGVLSR